MALLARELDEPPQLATRELIASIRQGSLIEPPPELPALAPEPAAPGPRALPALREDLVGREREMAELRHLLTVTRLVTLTGPGGVGKTRLALATAHDVQPTFSDGAAFVDLAPLEDAALVLPAIAAACGVHEEAGRSLLETVTDHLAARRLLLVVDNMEHVLAAAPVVGELLAACPHISIVVTSRPRLRLVTTILI